MKLIKLEGKTTLELNFMLKLMEFDKFMILILETKWTSDVDHWPVTQHLVANVSSRIGIFSFLLRLSHLHCYMLP